MRNFFSVLATPLKIVIIFNNSKECQHFLLLSISTLSLLGNFSGFSCPLLTFFKIYFFEKFLQEHYQSVKQLGSRLGPEVRKLFSCSTQLSMKSILLINVKMPTIVGILSFISKIITTSERLKARNFFICR